MFLVEVLTFQKIVLIAEANGVSKSFDVKVQEVYPKKGFIVTDAIVKDGKPVSFRSANISLSIMVAGEKEKKPTIFRNVESKLFQRPNGEYCYTFSCEEEGVPFNRRESFRCYVGKKSNARLGMNTPLINVIILDVSSTGFAIICDKKEKAEIGSLIITSLEDQPQEEGKIFSLQLKGIVKRTQEYDKDRVLYGCQLAQPVNGLNTYIMEKERVRLRATSGRMR